MFVPRSLNRQAGERLVVFSELRNAQRKGFTSNVSVVNAQVDGSDTALLKIDRLFCQAIPRVIESGPEILLCGSRWERQATRLPLCKYTATAPERITTIQHLHQRQSDAASSKRAENMA